MATHNIPGKRPKMEFQGANMDEISIEVILDAELGVKPRAAMKKFRAAAKKGKVHYFYVGGKKVVARKMYISAGTDRDRNRQGVDEVFYGESAFILHTFTERSGRRKQA